jgi:tetratricopeptide (TPR) repeat protein
VYLIWLCAICACQSAAAPTLAERCARAVDARRPDAADLCLPAYELTGDPATGGRAARALQAREGALPIVEWIANAVGDSAAGADAWLAAGVSRGIAGDTRGALAAYERAVAMRGAGDTLGQLRDAVGLIYYYLGESDFHAATRQAVIAHDLLSLVGPGEDRAAAYINIATLLITIGNLSVTEQILEEARCVIPVTSPQYARLRQIDAFVELGHERTASQRLALLEAHALALRDGNTALEWNTRFNLIDVAIRDGMLGDAAALLDPRSLPAHMSPQDRAVVAYYQALLAIARGDHAAAVQLIEGALPDASAGWIGALEDVYGRALVRAGHPDRAERALLRSVAEIERKRDALESDTFKSWLLADQRVPFEDLFLLYVTSGRLDRALGVVQRATARSTLDGLLQAESRSAEARGLAAVDEWSEGMRKLAIALRSSRAMVTPPISSLLAQLRGNHVITYFRARGDLWAIAVGVDGGLAARKIGGVAGLTRRLAAWHQDIASPALADELGLLLLPDELMPAPGTPIYVVEEDPIGDVSFAALRRHGELVLDHHPVAYAPSAAVLSVTRRSQAPIRAVVLGDPTGDLPEAREEARDVAGRLNVSARLGGAATRTAVLEAGDATVIHIAAHTVPTQTGAALLLADGLLDAGTVLDHGVAAGAIVLLTCSSAPIASRDELSALASAFLAAGAHTVIASRWSVDDKVAHAFARTFYQANGLFDPVQAVAVAQRALARDGIEVKQWSTFAVIGGLP